MKRFEKIPRELRQGRTKIVRDVTLDELLASTVTSQYSPTNLIWSFIQLLLEEYVFLNEKELFLSSIKRPVEFAIIKFNSALLIKIFKFKSGK